MKNLIMSIMLLTSIGFAGECWKIKDKDSKAFCESTAEGKKNCWKIKDKDSKAMCNSQK